MSGELELDMKVPKQFPNQEEQAMSEGVGDSIWMLMFVCIITLLAL